MTGGVFLGFHCGFPDSHTGHKDISFLHVRTVYVSSGCLWYLPDSHMSYMDICFLHVWNFGDPLNLLLLMPCSYMSHKHVVFPDVLLVLAIK